MDLLTLWAQEAAPTDESTVGLLQKLTDPQWLQDTGIHWGGKIAAALAIFVIGKWVAGVLSRTVAAAVGRAKLDQTLVKFLKNIVYALLMVFVVLAALDFLGIPTQSAVGVIAAAGFAVAFALQGSLANFAAGVMLVFFRPIAVGDRVKAGGTAGVVQEVGLFATRIRTPDGKRVIVPNNAVTGSNIENLSVNGRIRVDMTFGIGYEDDIPRAKAILEKIVADHPLVLDEPAPLVAVSELADSSVNFAVWPWCHPDEYWKVRFAIHEEVKLALDAAGISIPFPQRDVHLHQVA